MEEGLVTNWGDVLSGEEEATQGPQVNPLNIEGSTWSFLDGDTIKDSETGESVRLRGIDTRETAKFLKSYGFQEGELGGDAATAYIWDLANKHGFNRVVRSGDEGEFRRSLGDLVNSEGHSFVDTLLRTGVVSPSRFSTESDLQSAMWGNAAEAAQPFDTPKSDYEEARDAIYAAETDQYGGLPIQKLMAFDAAEYNANPDLYMGIKTRTKGADYQGRSRTPFGTGFDIGFANLYKSLNTFGQTITDRFGMDETSASFAADAAVNQLEMMDLPTIKMDVTEIDWTSFDEVSTGMRGMLGSSIPFMGATILGMAAVPVTYGTSMSLPVAMYTGMVLDEMEGQNEDKDIGTAIAAGIGMTVLDRLGIKGLISPKMMLTSEGRITAIKAIAKSNNISEAEASRELLQISKKELLKVVGDAKEFAAGQLQKGHLFRESVKRLAKSSGGEGTTEALQELTQYTAAVIGSEKEWNYDEIEHTMTNAIVAGGLMGSGFAAPGIAYQIGDMKAAADFFADNDGRFDNIHTGVRKEEEAANNGVVKSIEEITQENINLGKALGEDEINLNKPIVTIDAQGKTTVHRIRGSKTPHVDQLAEKHEAPGTTLEFIKAFINNPLVAVRASLANTVYKAKGRSKNLVKIYDMLGSTRNRVYTGVNLVNEQQLSMAKYDSILRPQEVIESSFDTPSGLSSAGRSDYVSKIVTKFFREVAAKDFDWTNASEDVKANKEALLTLHRELELLSDTMLNDNNTAKGYSNETRIEKLQNWAYRHKGFRKEYITKNKDKFIRTLMSEYKMDLATATELTDSILDTESVQTLSDAFDVTKAGVSPSFQKARELHISDRPAFDEFLEQNIFKNMSDASRESSRFQAHRKFLGKDSRYLNRMLVDVREDLGKTMKPEDADKLLHEIAFDLRNVINAESGNYKRIQNETLKQGQKYLTLLTTLQGLANAAFSSMPEMAMIPMGVPREILVQNSATQGYLFGSAVGAWMRNLAVTARLANPRPDLETFLDKRIAAVRSKGSKDPRYMFYTNMKEFLKESGFKSQETGAATTTGVQETNELTKGMADAFFKANFLHDQQDMHRMMRLSFFNDFLIDKLDLIESNVGKVDTIGVAEAKHMLRELGIPLSTIQPLAQKLKRGEKLTVDEEQKYKREFLNGATNFVNQAIPLPNAFNRPLFYSDPRFALLTQFNGFTSTFTANQLPMLWDQIRGKSSKGLTYGTFATVGSMLALSFMSHGIKDELKYGERSPYLTDAQRVQRAIYSSGLLGTTERVIGSQFVLPLYDSSSHNAGEFVWDNMAGEAAATGTIERAYGMVSSAVEGDGAKFEKSFWGSVPFLAPFKHRIINYEWD